MANKTVVLGIFSNEASADALKKSGVAHHDAIGVLALNEKGEVKTHKIGKRSVSLGLGIGLVLALAALPVYYGIHDLVWSGRSPRWWRAGPGTGRPGVLPGRGAGTGCRG